MSRFRFTIVGNPDDGFTSAEITADGEQVARVFELEAGWYVEIANPEMLRDSELVEVVIDAKSQLLHYVNRKGGTVAEGTTRAGASFWLMQRDDGKGFSAT